MARSSGVVHHASNLSYLKVVSTALCVLAKDVGTKQPRGFRTFVINAKELYRQSSFIWSNSVATEDYQYI